LRAFWTTHLIVKPLDHYDASVLASPSPGFINCSTT